MTNDWAGNFLLIGQQLQSFEISTKSCSLNCFLPYMSLYAAAAKQLPSILGKVLELFISVTGKSGESGGR